MSTTPPRVTFDEVADAAYIYLVDEIGWGEVKSSTLVPIEHKGSSVIVSLDGDGRALGIEFLGASNQFTPGMLEALAAAPTSPKAEPGA